MPRRVFITVAEVSGDQHAAELIRELRALDSSIEIHGVGGPRMAEAGATIVYDSVAAAAMGWRGALRAFEVVRLLRQTRKRYESEKPDLHVCVDSSAMNLPFARMASSMGVPVLYYIAPQLWASREGRMDKLRRYVNRVACILPFEEEYFRERGVDATYVGHPLFDELPADRGKPADVPRFPDAPPVIGLIAGSRSGEVTANFPHLVDVAFAMLTEFPEARFLVPTTPSTTALVRQYSASHRFDVASGVNVEFCEDVFDRVVPQCDLCFCKSGTSTLHVAAYGVPMIVVYRVNPVLWNVAGRFLIKTKKIALVNILAGNTDLVPEFIPWYGSNQPVIDCALGMLREPARLADQRAALGRLVASLDRPGASRRAAEIALSMTAEPAPAPMEPAVR